MRAPQCLVAILIAIPIHGFAADSVDVTKTQFDTWLQEISNWGRWGADDQLGTLNLITPEKSKAAADLVREGVTVSLALDLNKQADELNASPFEHTLTVATFGGHEVAGDRYAVEYHGFAHSHIDGLPHFAHEGKMYNGFSVDTLKSDGAQKLGIHNAKNGIVSRGVLIDMPWFKGVDYLEPTTVITVDDLEAWESKTGVYRSPARAAADPSRCSRPFAHAEWRLLH